MDKIKKLCVAAKSNEKLFWKLLKGQRSTTQMNAFLIDGKWITDKNYIHDMCENHFENLRKLQLAFALIMNLPTEWNIFASCQNELLGTLNEPLQ